MQAEVKEKTAIDVVNNLIADAVKISVSDIHFDPIEVGMCVRFRKDGLLHIHTTIKGDLAIQVIARLKVLAHIDVAQSRVPQDGTFSWRQESAFPNKVVDMRVATFPSVHGEKVVLRVLLRSHGKISLESLGFEIPIVKRIKRLAHSSGSFFLVSGPTGSGKTTTLYALLAELNSVQSHIITLEDPVECRMDGAIQGQVCPAIGFDFSHGLRAILRQDPDIILIGEIRDAKTAQIAIQAALSGHVVLSTIHTNDAVSVVVRLIDMGIEPFLINAALSGALAQRLMRTLCNYCKKETPPSVEERRLFERFLLDAESLYIAQGCKECLFLGYAGRVAIGEFFEMTDSVKEHFASGATNKAMQELLIKAGMVPMARDALQKVHEGKTSVQEFFRVIGDGVAI